MAVHSYQEYSIVVKRIYSENYNCIKCMLATYMYLNN